MTERPDRLSDSDFLIRRIEGDPVLRSPIVVVGLLDREPAWPRLRASVLRAVEAIPRLRQRTEPGRLGAHPAWVDDEAFSLDHHVRRVRVATSDGLRAVLDIAEPDVMTAFDPARPPWQLTVVSGLDGGAAAFVLRFHHTITDGVGGVALAQRLFDHTRRAPKRRPPDEPEVVAVSAPAAGLVHQAWSGLAGAARLAMDPIATASTGVRTARSIGKILAPARAPLSPILVGRGLDRRLHVLDVPLSGLQHAAHAAGGTVNDVLLAAVGGALREYHDVCGSPIDAVRVTMPISLRKQGDAPGGNHFTPARFVLPIDDPDPVHRIELAGAIVRSWRSEPAVGLTPALAWVLGLLPAAFVQRTFAGMLRSMDVDAVDVPGLQEPAYLAGAEVERLWAFAPPTGAALSITLVSHLQTACVGIACDVAAVQDPELLALCVEHAFDEVLAVGGAGYVSGVSA